MRGFFYKLAILAVATAGCTSVETDTAKTGPALRLGAYEGEQISGTHLLRVHSPWESTQYLSINFPEHCWGEGLPNVGHMSQDPISTPWCYNADSSEAVFEHSPRPGVSYRSLAAVDSMAVRLEMVIENKSDSAISDIRALVCMRADKMTGFYFPTYRTVYVWIDGQPKNIKLGTSYEGKMPLQQVAWALNVEGGPDNLTFDDMGWFRPGRGPGRIVAERASLPLITTRHLDKPRLWVATIWNPARIVFANPAIPCIHSDPLLPDCPPGETVRVQGLVLFHEGDLAGLLERARREMKL